MSARHLLYAFGPIHLISLLWAGGYFLYTGSLL